ncbi:hypothetical protein VP1G_09564 [Cytospora mali]|uniref:Uncharacterized protein n=1 Tax=Cytospora mali TaxID=578113 RepID=A0A194VEZ3_CYTMA|nr:hypothetical protein VP1G_09564 [Valsa mali var. pyri (nom. inval.)]
MLQCTFPLDSLPFLSTRLSHPLQCHNQELSNDFIMEFPDIVDNNCAKDEKPSEKTTAPELKPKLPDEMEKWSREWCEVS